MNAKEHPDGVQVERFLLGETNRAENQRVVRHLLRGCPECQKAARAVWTQTEAPPARLDLGRESG
jgi:hypothetical protein